ncbi:hypothetical protein AMTRI_Chr04g185500 [Amborella trichopoda]
MSFSSLICRSRKIQSMRFNVMYMNWVQWFWQEKRKWGIHELQGKEDSRTLKSKFLAIYEHSCACMGEICNFKHRKKKLHKGFRMNKRLSEKLMGFCDNCKKHREN